LSNWSEMVSVGWSSRFRGIWAIVWFRWVIVCEGVVLADLATKELSLMTRLSGDIAPMENPDYMLGILSPGDNWPLQLLAVAAVACLLIHAVRLTLKGTLPTWVTAVIVGGGIANFIDRWDRGAVLDWLVVGPLIINLADIAIAIGLVYYLIVALRRPLP